MSLREINLFHTCMEERQAALAMNCAGSVEDDMYLMLGTLTYLFPFSLRMVILATNLSSSDPVTSANSISFQAKNGRGWSSYVLRLISPTRQHRDEHNRIDVTFCIVTSHDREPRVNALSSSDVVIASTRMTPTHSFCLVGFSGQ